MRLFRSRAQEDARSRLEAELTSAREERDVLRKRVREMERGRVLGRSEEATAKITTERDILRRWGINPLRYEWGTLGRRLDRPRRFAFVWRPVRAHRCRPQED